MTDRYQIQIDLQGRDNLSNSLRNVNREIDGLTRHSANAGRSTNALGMDLSMLARSAGALGAGLLAGGLVSMISDMNALGDDVGAVKDRFEALVGSTEGAEKALRSLQQATGGSVDNMTLMQEATKMLRTGMAETADEASDLIGMIVKLRDPTTDAASAISSFSQMMATQSTRGLAQFGINATAVKEQMDALLASGKALNREDAFKLAVMAEGGKALEALGDSADVAEHNVNKLRTAFENARQEFGLFVNDVVEGAATIAVAILGIDRLSITEQLEREARDITSIDPMMMEISLRIRENLQKELEKSLLGALTSFSLNESSSEYLRFLDSYGLLLASGIENLADDIPTNPLIINAVNGLQSNLFEILSDVSIFDRTDQQQAMASNAEEVVEALRRRIGDEAFSVMNAIMDDFQLAELALNSIKRLENARAEITERELRQQAELNNAIERGREVYQSFFGAVNRGRERALEGIFNYNRAQSNEFQLIGRITDEWEAFWDVANIHQISGRGGMEIISREGANAIRDAAFDVERLYRQFADAAKDSEFVTDEEVERMRQMADQARGFADFAEKAADRLERMKIPELFGERGDARQEEVLARIMRALPMLGEDFSTEFRLNVGIYTPEGRFFEGESFDNLLSMMHRDLTDEEFMEVVMRIRPVLEEMRLNEIELNEENFISAMGMTMTEGKPTFEVSPTIDMRGINLRAGEGTDTDVLAVLKPGDIIQIEDDGGEWLRTTLQTGEGEIEGFVNRNVIAFKKISEGFGLALKPLAEVEGKMENTSESSEEIQSAVGEIVKLLPEMVPPLQEARTQAEGIDKALSALANTQFTTSLAIEIMFQDPSGMGLAASPAFQNAVMGAIRRSGVEGIP